MPLVFQGEWFENFGRYAYGFYLLMLIPIFPFVATFMMTSVAWAWARWVKRPIVAGVHLPVMCMDMEQVQHYFLTWMRSSIPVLGCCYNNICLQAFNVFSCKELRTHVKVMTAAPSIVCWESNEHTAMVAVSIAALIFYVFGLPCFILSTVVYARSKDMLRNPNVLLVMGMFYRKYGALLQLWLWDCRLHLTVTYGAPQPHEC